MWAERACAWMGVGGALAACYARWRAVLGGHTGDAGAARMLELEAGVGPCTRGVGEARREQLCGGGRWLGQLSGLAEQGGRE
jgi:hypothetical protein